MLQPLQLEEVSIRYAAEIAELRDFLAKSNLFLDTAEAMNDLTARLREDRGFRRDLKSHVWVAVHTSGRQISYSDLLGILAIAAAGAKFAAATDDADAHDLLRFLMEARSSFNSMPEVQNLPAVRRFAEPRQAKAFSFETHRDENDRRPIVWISAAACMLLVLLLGLLFYRHSTVDHGTQTASISGAAPGTTPAIVSANRDNGQFVRQQSETTAPAARRSPRHTVHVPIRRSSRDSFQARTATQINPTPATQSAAPLNSSLGLQSTSAPTSTVAKAGAAENPRPSRLQRRPPLVTSGNSSKDEPILLAKAAPVDTPGTNGSNPTSASHQGFVRSTSLGIMAANVTYNPAPAYPAAASSLHVQGEVKLEAEVDRDGNVVSTRIISGPPLLQEAAADAVQRWRYRPYLYEGKPIATNATVVLDFELPSL